ncbi:Atxe2 family lasso peptide isopeptidase [Sphingomonas oryzagri]
MVGVGPPPAVPAEIRHRQPVTIGDIVAVADLSSLVLSPDGQWIAFRSERASVARNGYQLDWYVAPVDGRAPARRIGDGGGALFASSGIIAAGTPVWAPSSSALYVPILRYGQVQVWRLPIDGSGAAIVTHDPANVRDLGDGDDGTSLVYSVGATRGAVEEAEQAADDDGVLIDRDVDPVMPLSHGDFVDGKPASTRFINDWFDRGPLLWNAPTRQVRFTLPPGDTSQPRRTDGIANGLGPVRIEATHGMTDLSVGLPDGSTRHCRAKDCTSDHVSVAIPIGDGRSLLVTTTDIVKRQTLSIWTPVSGRWRTLVRSQGLLGGDRIDVSVPCAASSRAIICIAAEPSGPPRLVSIDPRSGRMRTLFDPNAELRRRTLAVRLIQWRSPIGARFGGALLLPDTRPPSSGFPLVINYYSCGGFLRGGVGDQQPMLPLAEHGIASLCINQAWGPLAGTSRPWQLDAAVDGITAIIGQLARRHLVDPARIGMSGLSFGSEITMAVVEHSHLLRAAAISSAQIEPYYYWANHVPGRDVASNLRDWFHMGDPDSDIAGWRAYAPVRNIDRIHTPILMQMPENEMRLSMELYARLANSPTPVEMIAYADESHIQRQPRHRLSVYRRSLDWFRFWLSGEEDPAPAKAAQYARWRQYSARPGFALPVQDHPAP